MLGHYRDSDRVSLVEGRPFERELQELAPHFKTTSFPQVFRSTKLVPRRASFVNATIEPTRTLTPNYASMVRAAPPPQPALDGAPSTARIPVEDLRPDQPNLVVCRNGSGQRVDRPLQITSRVRVDALKHLKYCNQFHIVGSCPYERCTHQHGPRLPDRDIVNLMCIARLSPCPRGLQCDSETCVSGHQCPWDNCSGSGCRFPQDRHGVDTNIIMTE